MSRRVLPLLTSLLAALAVLSAARQPGAEPAFPAGFAIALLWRLALGLDGRGLLPRRLGALSLGTLLAVALPFLLTHAGSSEAQAFFVALLGVLTCFLGLVLLLPLGLFGCFWVVLLASTLVAITCSLERELIGALLVPPYVALLALTLIVLERHASAASGVRGASQPGRLVLRDPGSPLAPALGWGAARLVGTGLALGIALWAVMPRWEGSSAPTTSTAVQPGSAPEADAARRAGRVAQAMTGPDADTHDALLGAVEHIQEDKRVHWEVRLLEGAPEPTVLLREAVRDLWVDPSGAGTPRWRSSQAAERAWLTPEADGWVSLGDPVPGHPTRSLEARARLGLGLMMLEPEPLAFRIERPLSEDPAGPRAALSDATERLGSGRLRRTVQPGDTVWMRSQPQPREGAALEGRESSGRVAPLRVYAEIDAGRRARLLELTRAVPGAALADPWLRARALERWLQGPEFVYELRSPVLQAGRRVEDFLGRVRRGNCEWYATALTLVLRAHGLAARYVQGYWGGSHTLDTDLWTFYGAHYHAWTELYLDGVGWVPLNPTPPERLADGADPRTAEAGRGRGLEGGAPGTAPGEHLRASLADLGRSVADLLRSGFGPTGFYLGYALLAALLLAGLSRWRSTARAQATFQDLPRRGHGPYLEALRLLARHGRARRQGWTPREFLGRVRGQLPGEAGAAFARLTQRHEDQRYAAADHTAAGAAADLQCLSQSLRRPSTGG